MKRVEAEGLGSIGRTGEQRVNQAIISLLIEQLVTVGARNGNYSPMWPSIMLTELGKNWATDSRRLRDPDSYAALLRESAPSVEEATVEYALEALMLTTESTVCLCRHGRSRGRTRNFSAWPGDPGVRARGGYKEAQGGSGARKTSCSLPGNSNSHRNGYPAGLNALFRPPRVYGAPTLVSGNDPSPAERCGPCGRHHGQQGEGVPCYSDVSRRCRCDRSAEILVRGERGKLSGYQVAEPRQSSGRKPQQRGSRRSLA